MMSNTNKTLSMNQGIHLINEQLQIIRSSVEHLIMVMDISDEEKTYLDNIIDAVDHCSEIISVDVLRKDDSVGELNLDKILEIKGSKVLIIEDEKDIAEIYSSNLEYFGFDTAIASSFLKGMEIINKNNVDIVILDVMLPDAYGLDCVDVILAKNNKIKIVVATGKLDELKQDLSHLEGKCTILTKPFSIRALLAAVL